jgi:hypothetical protein
MSQQKNEKLLRTPEYYTIMRMNTFDYKQYYEWNMDPYA